MEWTVGECSCITGTSTRTRDCSVKDDASTNALCTVGVAQDTQACEKDASVCRKSFDRFIPCVNSILAVRLATLLMLCKTDTGVTWHADTHTQYISHIKLKASPTSLPGLSLHTVGRVIPGLFLLRVSHMIFFSQLGWVVRVGLCHQWRAE